MELSSVNKFIALFCSQFLFNWRYISFCLKIFLYEFSPIFWIVNVWSLVKRTSGHGESWESMFVAFLFDSVWNQFCSWFQLHQKNHKRQMLQLRFCSFSAGKITLLALSVLSLGVFLYLQRSPWYMSFHTLACQWKFRKMVVDNWILTSHLKLFWVSFTVRVMIIDS